jgi:hypothetical protein
MSTALLADHAERARPDRQQHVDVGLLRQQD